MMDIFSMDEKVSIISDVNYLVEKYGIDAVQHAVDYIKNFPKTGKIYKFTDGINTWNLTPDQFNKINQTYANGYEKIQAIKMFREITGCGLKEAKDAIENFYRV